MTDHPRQELPPPDPVPWHRRIAARARSHWLLKAVGTSVFMTVFFTAYFHLLKNPLFSVSTMPLTWIDRRVGFQPEFLGLYASLWIYTALPPALLATRREVVAYGWAIGSLCLAGMACFLIWPTAVPAAPTAGSDFPGFSLLQGVDAAGNACPSLHVATAVFSGLWLGRLLPEVDAPRSLRAANWLWCAGIVYSTLATKQHVALDVMGGLILGGAGALLSWPPPGKSRPGLAV